MALTNLGDRDISKFLYQPNPNIGPGSYEA